VIALQSCAKPMLLASLLLVSSMLAGCATTASVETSNKHVACDSFRPITWSKDDTVPTQREVVAHNSVGKVICGWVPPKRKR
jgi:hypothetical protein